VEPSSLAVRSGTEVAQDASADDLLDLEGHLDVDLAELSLGQRLTALNPPAQKRSEAENSDSDNPKRQTARASRFEQPNSITLARTLIQALHSTDTKLLETCLAYSDSTLIMQTVQRLPSQLAVPLLGACVQRLGRTTAPSSQRAAVLVRWIRTVLVVHSGHLMTVRANPTSLFLICVITTDTLQTLFGPCSFGTDARLGSTAGWLTRDANCATHTARVATLIVREARHGTAAGRSARVHRPCSVGT
jgi:hypothetical protein